jgi:prepilin-type N-terminal cleavage/methylation domain-containing protein
MEKITKQGFTLAEMAIVMLIISLVMAVGAPMFTKSQINSNNELTDIKKRLEALENNNNDDEQDVDCGVGMIKITSPFTLGEILCVSTNYTPYTAINTCSDTTWDLTTTQNSYCDSNGWAGAKKACAAKGMRLPTRAELDMIYVKRAIISPSYPYGSIHWTSTENDANSAWTQMFGDDSQNPSGWKNRIYIARCVKTPN